MFFHKRSRFIKNTEKKEIAAQIYDEIDTIYCKVPCVMKNKRFCLDQICNLYNDWDRLRRNELKASEKSISKFLKVLEKTCNLVGKIANAVLDKLKRHTWFLNMEYAPFFLFSEFVSDREKHEIATALNNVRPPAQYKGGYPSEVKLSVRPHIARNYKLSSFVKSGSHFIFDTMNFDKTWLSLPLNDWKNHDDLRKWKVLSEIC